MLPAEARWLGLQLEGLEANSLSPMLNVGSSDAQYTAQFQPWITTHCFAPLKKRGIKIINMDKFSGPGIDWVADIESDSIFDDLKDKQFAAIWCTNMLEHVYHPEKMAQRLFSSLKDGGILILSTPYQFPYHEDPIDTGYRPSLEELAKLFPRATIIAQSTVRGGLYLGFLTQLMMKGSKRELVRRTASHSLGKKILYRQLKNLFCRISANCIILRKPLPL